MSRPVLIALLISFPLSTARQADNGTTIDVTVTSNVSTLTETLQPMLLTCNYEFGEGYSLGSIDWNYIIEGPVSKPMYEYHHDDASNSGPVGEYINRLIHGDPDEALHYIILTNATWCDEGKYQCIIKNKAPPIPAHHAIDIDSIDEPMGLEAFTFDGDDFPSDILDSPLEGLVKCSILFKQGITYVDLKDDLGNDGHMTITPRDNCTYRSMTTLDTAISYGQERIYTCTAVISGIKKINETRSVKVKGITSDAPSHMLGPLMVALCCWAANMTSWMW